jgi:hypothetical protein
VTFRYFITSLLLYFAFSYLAFSYACCNHHSIARISSSDVNSNAYHATDRMLFPVLTRASCPIRVDCSPLGFPNLKITEFGPPIARVTGSPAKIFDPR